MLVQAAEEAYRRGRTALASNRLQEALAMFEAAIEVERRQGQNGVQPRYLSHYGLCLALSGKGRRQGIEFCREAAGRESFNADIQCNLGRALLAAGRRREAHRALRRGYSLEPAHVEIRRALQRMGRRRRPVLPFLKRSHPLNVFLGKARKLLS